MIQKILALVSSPVVLVVVAVIAVGLYVLKKWKVGGKVPVEWLKRDLSGKNVIITGSNTGIGLITAKELAKMKATVVIAARDEEKGREAVRIVKEYSNNDNVSFAKLDLNSLESVRQFAKKMEKEDIHYLINNAGVMFPPHGLTKDGFEVQLGVNHLGHFLLTMLLIDNLKRNKARVINLSSLGHTYCRPEMDLSDIRDPGKKYSKMYLYGRSKLANVLFTKELQSRYGKDGIVSYSLHPGNIMTELGRHLGWINAATAMIQPLFMKTPWEGAQTTLYAVLCDTTKVPPGSYLADCDVKESGNPNVYNKELQKKLWEISEKAVGL